MGGLNRCRKYCPRYKPWASFACSTHQLACKALCFFVTACELAPTVMEKVNLNSQEYREEPNQTLNGRKGWSCFCHRFTCQGG